ncbi:hypothetical protein [Bacillus sp. 7884-1]|nr:hypothetical protein [Bacillus sp. 7884-1]
MYLDRGVKEICKRIGTAFIAAIATGTVCGIFLTGQFSFIMDT